MDSLDGAESIEEKSPPVPCEVEGSGSDNIPLTIAPYNTDYELNERRYNGKC